MTEPTEGGRLSVDLGMDLTTRLRRYAETDRRPVDAVVADAVEEYLGAHPDHEQLRAAGLAEAKPWVDRLVGPADDDQVPQEGGPLTGGGV